MSRRRLRRSLLWTFSGAFLIVLVGGVVLQVLLTAGVLRPAIRHWHETTRKAIAQTLAAHVAEAIERGEDLNRVLGDAGRSHRGLVLIYRDSAGRISASVPPEELPGGVNRILRGPPRGPGPGPGRRMVGRAPVTVDGEVRGTLFVLPRFPDPKFGLEGFRRPWLLFLPLAAIVAGIAGFLLFRNLSRRLAHLEDRVRRIADGDLEVRVTGAGNDEIGRLGEAVNIMAERLSESRQKLLEADQQRRRFLADVTHDLATPLTSIRGYAETLLDSNVPKSPEETGRYLRFIQEEALRMDELANDLLDLAWVESGSLRLQREPIDLISFVVETVDRLRPTFARAGIDLRSPEPVETPIVASVDRRRVEQLLVNLTTNAREQLSEGGEVIVRVERGPGDAAALVVEDNGPGFREEDLPYVFDRFYRGDPARSSGGTGLGLAIVRGIAEAHGGEARAENREEGGARVVVTIPLGEGDDSSHPHPSM
jgi:signal transduction histidine kinase